MGQEECMGLLPEIEHRRSVREYDSEGVDRAALDRILNAGRLAPSAKNRQAWRFVVVQDGELRARIQEAAFGQEYVGRAPVIVALCTTNIEYRMPNGQLSYPVDLSIAAGFMMIQAEHEGLGTCPVTTFREEDVKSILSVPYSMRIVMLLTIGHGKGSVEDPDRLSFDRVVGFDHW
jgi:nitroreductase